MFVKDYYLPDFDIFSNNENYDFSVWQPDKKYIILGRSNNLEDSVNIEKALEDNITVMQRKSGGEAVVLSENMIVISVKIIETELKQSKEYFDKINRIISETLEKFDIQDIGRKGISDVTIGDKKILGSSIYRKKNIVFYHCVINVLESIDLISKYLKHPQKEPDYRKGRSHSNFVTSIYAEGYNYEISELIEAFKRSFTNHKSDFDFSNHHLPH